MLHTIDGIKDTFSWGKEFNNVLVMSSGGKSLIFNDRWIYGMYKVDKKSVQPNDTLNCKDRIEIKKDFSEIAKFEKLDWN